jgi:thiol:disulfide interchange protein
MPLKALLLLFLFLPALAPALAAAPKKPAGYDPQRDPAADLQKAIGEAQSGGQHILLEVGGEWCGWCHLLNRLFTEDAEVAKRLHENFVVVKVNWSPENENEAFLSRYPAMESYPHVYVLDAQGQLLHANDLTQLEAKKGYDRDKLLAFLKQWSPPAGAPRKRS